MVNIEDISVKTLHRKLKSKRVEGLIRRVFEKPLEIDKCAGSLYIREKHMPNFLYYILAGLGVIKSNSFLNISLIDDEFRLEDKDYFNKTFELAKEYQTYFGGEIAIKLDYISKE